MARAGYVGRILAPVPVDFFSNRINEVSCHAVSEE